MLAPCGLISLSTINLYDDQSDCPNVVMLSSTSLLHGNCVFNRNNTVATQQGMKTYWLCKSYRISMCRARCITHQGKIISATGIHNHAPHMRGNNSASGGSNTGCSGGGNTGNSGGSNNNASLATTQTSSNLTAVHSLSSSLRYSQGSGINVNSNNQNYPDHQHPLSSPPQQHPSAFVANSHGHPGNSNLSSAAPSSHLFLQTMPNLLVQHYPNSQPTQIMQPPTFTTQHHNVLHSYEISPAMQPSPSEEHSRNTNSSFDQNDKTLNSINKPHINDEHILVQNAAELSPSNVQNSSIKTSQQESLAQQNEIRKKLPSAEQHHVQVIDSITISPGSGHNFKLESM